MRTLWVSPFFKQRMKNKLIFKFYLFFILQPKCYHAFTKRRPNIDQVKYICSLTLACRITDRPYLPLTVNEMNGERAN